LFLFRNYKFILYSAPFNPITFNKAVFERNWFNIFSIPDANGYRRIDEKKINKYREEIDNELNNISNEEKIDFDNIFIGGFSQGACMAINTMLNCDKNLAGVISLSGFNFDFNPADNNKKNVPILSINGTMDDTIILRHFIKSFNNLKKLVFNLNLIEEVDLGHAFTRSGLEKCHQLMDNKLI
jgi:predicted esterase